jgi:hypothetical protein
MEHEPTYDATDTDYAAVAKRLWEDRNRRQQEAARAKAQERRAGFAAGHAWAASAATAADLAALAQVGFQVYAAGGFRQLGLDQEHAGRSEEFARGFGEGALHVWQQVKPLLRRLDRPDIPVATPLRPKP